MAVMFTQCHFEHLALIHPAPVQTLELGKLLGVTGAAMVQRSVALTAWRGSTCLGVAGLLPIWESRAEVWSILSVTCEARDMPPIVRKMRNVIDNSPARRIEMTVRPDNETGKRLACVLGLNEPPVLLRAYHPLGHDMTMYARVR